MDELLLTNIFFVITSIAVVAVTILVIVLLFHVIKTVRAVQHIVEKVKRGADVVAEDASAFRAQVKDGTIIGRVISAIVGGGFKTKRKEKKKKEDE